VTPILYQCLILIIRLSCTVSDIIKFFVSQKWRHEVFSVRGCCRWFIFAFSDRTTPDLITVFKCNYTSIMHQNNTVFCLPEMTPWCFLRLGALQVSYNCEFFKGAPTLYLCLIVTIRLSCTVSYRIKLFVIRKWHHGVFSAQLCRWFIFCGFWKGDPDFSLCFINILYLSCTVSKLIHFVNLTRISASWTFLTARLSKK